MSIVCFWWITHVLVLDAGFRVMFFFVWNDPGESIQILSRRNFFVIRSLSCREGDPSFISIPSESEGNRSVFCSNLSMLFIRSYLKHNNRNDHWTQKIKDAFQHISKRPSDSCDAKRPRPFLNCRESYEMSSAFEKQMSLHNPKTLRN